MESNVLASDPHSKKMPLFSSKRIQRSQAVNWYKKQGAALKNHIRSWVRQDPAPHDAAEALTAWMDRAHPTSDVLLKHDDSPLPLPRQASQPPSRRLSVFQAPVAEEKVEDEQETDSPPLLPFLFDDDNDLEEHEDHASTSTGLMSSSTTLTQAVTDEASADTPEPEAKIGREGEEEEASSPSTLPAQDCPSWTMQLQRPQKQQPMLKDMVSRAHDMPCHMNKVKGRLYGWFLGTFLYKRPLSRRSSTKEEKTLVGEEDTQSAHPISTPIPTPIYQQECFRARSPPSETSATDAPRENELMPESKDFLAFCDSAYFGI